MATATGLCFPNTAEKIKPVLVRKIMRKRRSKFFRYNCTYVLGFFFVIYINYFFSIYLLVEISARRKEKHMYSRGWHKFSDGRFRLSRRKTAEIRSCTMCTHAYAYYQCAIPVRYILSRDVESSIIIVMRY